MSRTIVLTVSSIYLREKLMKNLYANLTKEPSLEFIVQQDQVNRIKILKRIMGGAPPVLIRTYLVVVVPVLIDLVPLLSLHGDIEFRLDETIEHLESLLIKVRALHGHKLMGVKNGTSLDELVGKLSVANGEHRASSSIR